MDFAKYLKDNEQDQYMVLKFLKQLPQSIFDVYSKELKGSSKDDSILSLSACDLSQSFTSHSSEGTYEPEFMKKYVHAWLPKRTVSGLSLKEHITMTHDVIGKPLTAIFRDTDENGMMMDLPKVFMAIQNYFIENPEQLANSRLFEKLDIE